jgi:hypothetical protein
MSDLHDLHFGSSTMVPPKDDRECCFLLMQYRTRAATPVGCAMFG